MKKQSSSKHNVESNPAVTHLDTTLTEITATTTHTLQRWWKPLLATISALVLCLLLYQGLRAIGDMKDASLNERAYGLFSSPAAAKEDYQLDPTALQSLLSDVHGRSMEPFVYRSAVEHYLNLGARLSRKARENEQKPVSTGTTVSTPSTATPEGNLQPTIDVAYNQALTLAEQARSKMANDGDVEVWAQKVKSRIEGERKKDWLPAKWKFSLPTPKPLPDSNTPSNPDLPAGSATPAAAESKPPEASTDGQPANK